MFEVVVDSWNQWARSTRGTKAMRAWGARDPALEGWPIAELRAPVASTRTDAMQAALVALAQEHETMAATTLAVQLRPGLTRVVRLALAGGCWVTGPDDAPYHVLGVFYETLMRHPLERRPTKIAANLVQDTRQRIWRTSDGPRAKGPGLTRTTAMADEQPEPEAVLDLVAEVTWALGQLAGSEASRRLTAELAVRAWILDQSRLTIAREVGLGHRADNTRLCRLRSVVRQVRARTAGEPAAGRATVEAAPRLYARRARPEGAVSSRSDGSAPPPRPVGPSLASRQ
jgi:hypothetical protein